MDIELSSSALDLQDVAACRTALKMRYGAAADGIVRLWADGDLKAEDTGIELRKNKGDGIVGVLADMGYMRQPPTAPGSLRFSAFEISWR